MTSWYFENNVLNSWYFFYHYWLVLQFLLCQAGIPQNNLWEENSICTQFYYSKYLPSLYSVWHWLKHVDASYSSYYIIDYTVLICISLTLSNALFGINATLYCIGMSLTFWMTLSNISFFLIYCIINVSYSVFINNEISAVPIVR